MSHPDTEILGTLFIVFEAGESAESSSSVGSSSSSLFSSSIKSGSEDSRVEAEAVGVSGKLLASDLQDRL